MERGGLEFHPLEESFQPIVFPVTSYITATEVHQGNRPSSSRTGGGAMVVVWSHCLNLLEENGARGGVVALKIAEWEVGIRVVSLCKPHFPCL